MIHQAAVSVETQWQKELKQSFTKPEELLTYLQLGPENFVEDIHARKLFNMRVPRYFASLMKKGNADDPLLQQVLPSKLEFIQPEGYVADPLEEQDNKTPGLLHKYKSRVLIIFKGGCAINCRYCFRRHFPYGDNAVNKHQLTNHLEYIKSKPEINEVILSGGDPLMANDHHIAWFIQQLEALPHIKRLRIHTRLPVVIPNRITDELIEIIQRSRLKTIMVLHINHPQEIARELTDKVRQLKQQGIWVLNQAVLLKGVNDSVAIQTELSETLFDSDIQPYYLHLLDKVSGASHFDMNEEDAKKLYQQMLAQLPGFLVPKLVREIGGEPSKTPILPI